MRVAICGPNIQFSHGCTFEVHTADCRDLHRGACRREKYPIVSDVESLDDVVLAFYGPDAGDFDFDLDSESDWKSYRSEFYFAPCVVLPQSVEDDTEDEDTDDQFDAELDKVIVTAITNGKKTANIAFNRETMFGMLESVVSADFLAKCSTEEAFSLGIAYMEEHVKAFADQMRERLNVWAQEHDQ